MEDYDSLLERAQAKIPQSSLKTERFEIPKVRGHLQGNKKVPAKRISNACKCRWSKIGSGKKNKLFYNKW